MAVAKTLEDIITEQAPIVCEQIEAATAFAESEMDLQIEVEKALEVFRKEANLPELKGHHNVTIGEGHPDSVYDYVVIEYKKPGLLKESNDAPKNREVIKQLKDRFVDLKKEHKKDITELFGVGTDGHYFIFARVRSGKWDISQPLPRSDHTVETFLRRLVSLGVAGKPFLPDYLAGDFGAESERKLAREGIEKLYWRIRAIEKDPDTYPKAKVLFDQWRILFGEVCGYDIKTPSSKIKQLGEFYGVKKDPNPAALLFAVHSYYSLFMKFLAAEIATLFNPLSTSFLARLHQTGSSENLSEELRELEDGGIYHHLGIKNFLEGDLFSWYLDAWDDEIVKVIRQMVACLDEYDPKTLSIDPVESRDLLKKLYQLLFPKTVRHDLGEYYTPDWLAELVIERVGYDGNPDQRVLDPACGSGTFLVMAINKVREYAEKNMIPKHELLPKILNNIVGFDLNPLAVMAARTNYLMALRELLKLGGEIEIPVYLCDSIMTPAEYGELITKEGTATGGIGKVQELKTSAASFMIPTEIAQSRQAVAAYTEELEHCIRNDYTEDEFIHRIKGEKIPVASEDLHKTLYRQVLKLKKQNQNDIWARIIKNSFAPLFIEPVDYAIGNPPWINWENLPEIYKEDVKPVMKSYGLMSAMGWSARLGPAKYDISSLFVYSSVGRYLSDKGKLGFLVTQSLFQGDAGGGFRRFEYTMQSKKELFKVEEVYDLTSFQPFEKANNRTSFLICTKGKKTEYPLPYWKVYKEGSFEFDTPLETTRKYLQFDQRQAQPVKKDDPTSRWLILGEEESWVEKALGESDYKALMGSNTEGANGVYWVEIIDKAERGSFLVRNVVKGLKRPVPQKTKPVESFFFYPLLRSGDLTKWQIRIDAYIIFTSKHFAEISEKTVKQNYPKTWAYFSIAEFKKALAQRKSFHHKLGAAGYPFYTMYGSEEMLGSYKTVWKRMGNRIEAAVVAKGDSRWLPNKPVIPQETIIFVSSESLDEAHYLCAVVNSGTLELVVKHYSTVGGKAFASAHVLQHVRVPKFNSKNKLHDKLSQLSQRAHQLQAAGKEKELAEVEKRVDEAAAELWGITSKELIEQRVGEMAAVLRGRNPQELEEIIKVLKKD